MFKARRIFNMTFTSLLLCAGVSLPRAAWAKNADVTINFLSYEEFNQLSSQEQEAYMDQMQEFVASLDRNGVDVASLFEQIMASPKASWLESLLTPAEAADPSNCSNVKIEVKNGQICEDDKCGQSTYRCNDRVGEYIKNNPEKAKEVKAANAALAQSQRPAGSTAPAGAPPVRTIPTSQEAADKSKAKPLPAPVAGAGGVAATAPVKRRGGGSPAPTRVAGASASIAPGNAGDLPAKTTGAGTPPPAHTQGATVTDGGDLPPPPPAPSQGAGAAPANVTPAPAQTQTAPPAPTQAPPPETKPAPAPAAKPAPAKADSKKKKEDKKTDTAESGSFRCIYAGFTIYGKDCVPRRSYTDPKTGKVYSCAANARTPASESAAPTSAPLPPRRPRELGGKGGKATTDRATGGILCNPALFGTQANGEPICIDLSKRRSATKICLDKAKKIDGNLKRAVEIAKHDPKMMWRIQHTVSMLCDGKQADEYIKAHLASLNDKSRADLAETCKVYKDRFQDFQREKGPNGKPRVKHTAPAGPTAPPAPAGGTPAPAPEGTDPHVKAGQR